MIWKKSRKYNTIEHTIYVHMAEKYKQFAKARYVSIGRVGRTTFFYVQITKDCKATTKEFSSHKKAVDYAEEWMKAHPE